MVVKFDHTNLSQPLVARLVLKATPLMMKITEDLSNAMRLQGTSWFVLQAIQLRDP